MSGMSLGQCNGYKIVKTLEEEEDEFVLMN